MTGVHAVKLKAAIVFKALPCIWGAGRRKDKNKCLERSSGVSQSRNKSMKLLKPS